MFVGRKFLCIVLACQTPHARILDLLHVGKQIGKVVHKCHLRGSPGCIGIDGSESLKGDRHWALHHLALDQWQQTDAVCRLGLPLGHQA